MPDDDDTLLTRRPDHVDVSVVVPSHNEEDNVLPLLEQFAELARKARFTMEVVWVDDGSTDRTLPRAVDAQARFRFLQIVSLPYRRGLTEALRAGFSAARGGILVFYPADMQFHPNDIPRMVEKVRAGFDLVTGRKIGQYSKRFVSGFYNRLSRLLFPSVKVSDLNSVKAFRRELVNVFDYRHDWHRYWVAIAAEAGYRVGEVDVTLYERKSGRSKFGIWRIPGGVLDLLAVKFQYHTMRRPLWYFGMTGILLLVAAFIVGIVALYERFALGQGHRTLIYLVMTLGISGLVFFAIGFIAESVAGVRQQLETMRTAPRYHVHRADRPPRIQARSLGPAGAGERRHSESDDRRSHRRPDRRREPHRDRSESRRERPVSPESGGGAPRPAVSAPEQPPPLSEPADSGPNPSAGVPPASLTPAQTSLLLPRQLVQEDVGEQESSPVAAQPPAEPSEKPNPRPNQYGRRNRP